MRVQVARPWNSGYWLYESIKFDDCGTIFSVTGQTSYASRRVTRVYRLGTPWDVSGPLEDITPGTRIPRSVPANLPNYERSRS